MSTDHYVFIGNALTSNDELTTRQVRGLLVQEFPELSVSLSTVKRARYVLGWVATKPKYCQLIRDAKRLAWCQKMMEEGEEFNDVIFTDESSVMLETHRKSASGRKVPLASLSHALNTL